MRLLLLLALAIPCVPALTQQPSSTSASAPTQASSSEMKQIFDEDQAVRQPGAARVDGSKILRDDAARREATKKLLDSGALHTGDDFLHAAFVFQHGDKPEDYLLAHTLACIAVAKGQRGGLWIASATLDRYLQKIGQPQIYGTQYSRGNKDAPWTQEPYNRTLVSDALRKELAVPSMAAQANQLNDLQAQFPSK